MNRQPFWSLCPALALVAAGLALAGCASGSRTSNRDKPLVVPKEVQEKYSSPIGTSELRERALDGLGKTTSDPVPQLRANALEGMSVSPSRLRPYLPAALRDPNPGVRSTAAILIGRMAMRDLAPAARPLVDDPNAFVKAAAIYACLKCGESVDATPMAQLLLNDPSPRVRAQVGFLLGELGDPSAVALLRQASHAQMPRALPAEVRLMQLQLAEAMVKLGDDSQLETIRAALYPSRPEDLEATALAVQIIGQVRDKQAMDELVYLSARQNKNGQYWPAEIRLAVAGAMARLGKTEGTFLADEYATNESSVIRAQAAYVYGEIGRPENLGKLAVLMDDNAGIVQVAAAAAVLRTTVAGVDADPQSAAAR